MFKVIDTNKYTNKNVTNKDASFIWTSQAFFTFLYLEWIPLLYL